MLTRMLESRGAEVQAASSADEALALIETATPDLLISDIGMPRVDGYELMRRIRRQERAPLRAMPAIALTAFARPGDAARAREVGFATHLAKPVEPALLFSTIDGFLPRRATA
jgi:CheY-like chemotaxis protein